MRIFLIGPGGVGKSTCGVILADILSYDFIDLDTEFCNRIENINVYINSEGYKKYCFKNSELFYDLLEKSSENSVFALSSGFLVHENLDKLISKHKQTLKEQGISILLLPSDSLEESLKVVVERQLSRGFNLKEDKEKTKFTRRFPKYKKFGDIKIFSYDIPEIIAKQIEKEIISHNK